MARRNKVIRLTPVDDAPPNCVPVIRLESNGTLDSAKPQRPEAEDRESPVCARLHVPTRREADFRTHEAEVTLLAEPSPLTQETVEESWGGQVSKAGSVPWGWFALVGLLLASFTIWSSSRLHDAEARADKILQATRSTLANDAKENQAATELIDRIEAATKRYFATTEPAMLIDLSRQPERIRPLVAHHYQGKSISPSRVTSTLQLKPLVLDNGKDFWLHTVRLENNETRNVVVEILSSGEAKIDWEAFATYQPMTWDEFALTRPAGAVMDFRVYLEPDHFFSHEFADASRWNSFRLTAINSDETLFGYMETSNPAFEELRELVRQSRSRKIPAILRLSIPAGVQSRRGVVIEKLLSPGWIYLHPPDA
jgi:hypothetical protein